MTSFLHLFLALSVMMNYHNFQFANAEYAENEGHNSVEKRSILFGPVAFSFYLSARTSALNDSTILFDEEIINDGDAYDNTTGIFTVPVTGTYLFAFYIEDWIINSDQKADLMVNGNIFSSALIRPSGRSTQSGNTVIIHLIKNDKVSVQVNIGNVYGNPSERFTTFSGYLLY